MLDGPTVKYKIICKFFMKNVSISAKVRGGGRQRFYSKSFERISATLSLADPKQDPPHTLEGGIGERGGGEIMHDV